MTTTFLHGVEIVELDSGTQPIKTARSAVIGLIGTAPDADVTAFPLDTPVLVTSLLDADKLKASTGTVNGTLYGALCDIFAQASAAVVVIRVAEGAGADADTKAIASTVNVIGGTSGGAYVGAQALLAAKTYLGVDPRILIAPGFTSRRPNGVVSCTQTNGGTTTYASAPVVAFTAGINGRTAKGTAVLGSGANSGKVTAILVTDPGEYAAGSPPTITFTGGGGAGAAFTSVLAATANPVVAALSGIADRLRAVIIADGPNGVDSDAITYRGDWGSKRIYVVDPGLKMTRAGIPTVVPSSAAVAGLLARVDDALGFWWSPSNQVINGALGTGRPIDFVLGDVNCRANILNDNEVATIIRENGYRLWGNRTTSNDAKWVFLSVVRTADIIQDSLQRAHLEAVDKCIGKSYINGVVDSVNAYLRQLQALGAILGGKCWVDPSLNTNTSLAAGQVFFDFDFTPPYPAERVTFRSHLVSDYAATVLVSE